MFKSWSGYQKSQGPQAPVSLVVRPTDENSDDEFKEKQWVQ